MFEIRINGCKELAMIEASLIFSGAEQMEHLDVLFGDNKTLFGEQIEYKSNVFHRDYKIASKDRWQLDLRWAKVTFKYNKNTDTGIIEISGQTRNFLEKIIESQKLLNVE